MTKSEEEKLKEIVGKYGEISLHFGGFEVVVNDREKFRWNELFEHFFEYGYNVYVAKREGKIHVIAKQV